MSVAETHVDVIYRGHGNDNPAGGRLVTIETPDGDVIGQLRHVVKHSPTGYTWGYGGSGPADLALSLLTAALGDDGAKCRVCAGTRRITYDAARDEDVRYDPEVHGDDPETPYDCYYCDDGRRRLPYQDFKFQYVATWPESWTMARSQILGWLAARGIRP